MTSDVERARTFYGELFGWTADEPAAEFGGYLNFRKNGEMVAGCMAAQPGQDVANVWTIYLAVADAAAAVEATQAAGGQVMVPAMPVGDLGVMGVVSDVGGAVIGMWQAGTHKGFLVYGEPGTPSWWELMTRDYEPSLEFYRRVFGWTTQSVSDTDEFRYSTMMDGENWGAGVADAREWLPEGVPAHWSVYFGVEDTDATLKRLTDLGGAVVRPAEDTPYGRLATVSDPMGAMFKLVGPNEAMPMQ